jgi:hypothetical protein
MDLQPSWRFRHEEDSDAKDGREDHTKADGDAPGARVGQSARAQVEAGGDQNAEGDEQLICSGEGASDGFRRSLGLIQRRCGGQSANANARNPAANSNLPPAFHRGDLDDDAQGEYQTLEAHGPSL